MGLKERSVEKHIFFDVFDRRHRRALMLEMDVRWISRMGDAPSAYFMFA